MGTVGAAMRTPSALLLAVSLAVGVSSGCDKSGGEVAQPEPKEEAKDDGPTPPKLPPPPGQPIAQVIDCSAKAEDGSLSCSIGCVNANPTCSQGASAASCSCTDPLTISTNKCAIADTCEVECKGPESAVCENGVCGCQAPG